MPDHKKNTDTENPAGKSFKPVELEIGVIIPKCPCGKIPLKCPHPNNCLMENL